MIIVFYGELSTKGKNRMDFIKLLGQNIRASLKEFPALKYEVKRDHIYIHLNGEDKDKVLARLKKVPGIGAVGYAKSISNDMETLCKEAAELYLESGVKTFKIDTKRIDKSYPVRSDDVSKEVGAYVLEHCEGAKVDVHHPEVLIYIAIREDGTYIYAKPERALGGYPLGINGKSLCLLSGGIDSPVAAYMMMRRGIKLECIHFAAPPYTSGAVIEKIRDLLHVLNDYQSDIKLYIVPFTELERKIYEEAGPSYCVTIMRRMMLRIAEGIARHHKDLVLSSGESLGQVASQTLHSIRVIEECCNMPIIRPLATMDKLDIIAIAEQIGTYDISIRPYEDCCTIFTIKDPATRPNLKKVREIESRFDYASMISDCIKNTTYEHITPDEEEF